MGPPESQSAGERIARLEVRISAIYDELKLTRERIETLQAHIQTQNGSDRFAAKVGYVVLVIGAALIGAIVNVIGDLFRHHQ